MSTAREPAPTPSPRTLSVPDAVGSRPVVGMIWAQTEDGVIGKDGGIPWHVPEDLAHFRATTTGHPVIMGRRTWESFPERFRPLPDRTNIVISRSAGELPGAVVVPSLETALALAADSPGAGEIWIIGGGRVYADGMAHANAALVTVVESAVEGDTLAPALGAEWSLAALTPESGWLESSKGPRYRISLWTKQE
ncbi:dihydrofolate reductase [Arthrobacter agilis]|uniref:dihydrofolate reductase n=1 Tax=Arthrobacter agilis TaxID=37921 RepID=UPI000B358C99|nr:dihydrofolate reductase [Arthrobacter agilis]OUM41604.1 dihydrofolate reductase [Arthrobacter agilis]PPB47228.1 dihydrofolate reductase [Arthrobacter agilis]TPV26820.1 dihydrofolate reductase [Arthrobacter agilis]VDR33068.1 Dihydrofolate reductase [Arthrobacter agilis]